MDGLMLDTERMGIRISLETAKRLGYPLTEECVRATLGMTWEDTLAFYKATYPNAEGLDEYARADQRAYDEAVERDGIPVKEGCRELLEYLRGKGMRCVVATSCSRSCAELCLQKTGLMDYFERIFCGSEVAVGKPTPDLFLLACRDSGVTPSEAVVLEDSVNGLLAARAGGIRCILVPDIIEPTREQEQMAYIRLDSLMEVVEREIL